MKAKQTKPGTYNGTNYAPQKELVQSRCVIGTKKGEQREIITARWYMGRSSSASVVYCTIWFTHGSGSGKAGGYGYHKVSAAFASALEDAGIELYQDQHGDQYGRQDGKPNRKTRCYIGGCGDSSVDQALEALARALGYRKWFISNG